MKGGGGGGAGNPNQADTSRPDDSTPTEPVANREQTAGESVAPKNISPPLILRKVKDLLDKGEVTPDVEKAVGMNRTEMEQFVEKFEKAPTTPTREGKEFEFDPADPNAKGKEFDPNRTLPDLNPTATINTDTVRRRGGVVQDQERGLNEGIRFQPPAELRAGFEAYKKSKSKGRRLNATPRQSLNPSGAGGK